jgi:hypothetical protein
MARNDYVFSYWLIVWYAFYMIIGNKYISNPKFALICGLIHNLTICIIMCIKQTKLSRIFSFITMMILIKIIPLYYLYNTKIHLIDIQTMFILLICYFLWLRNNNQPILKYIIDYDYIIKQDNIFSNLVKNI